MGLYHAGLGVATFEAQNLTESQKELDQALLLDPQATPAYLWRARLLARRGQQDKAIADLETYVALESSSADGYHELEELYVKTGQAEKASAARAKYEALGGHTGRVERGSSFLDQLWITRICEALGRVG